MDVNRIYELIQEDIFKEDGSGSLIPVSRDQISELVKDRRFYVAYLDGTVIGCASVIDYGTDGERIAELRSVKVDSRYRGYGAGKKLIEHGKQLAIALGYDALHALVNREAFPIFQASNFELVDYRPIQKVSRDCTQCPLYNNGCKESTFVYRVNSN